MYEVCQVRLKILGLQYAEGQRPIVERLLLAAYSIGQCYIAASNGCGSTFVTSLLKIIPIHALGAASASSGTIYWLILNLLR